MIALPPGCTVNHAITMDVEGLTTEMIEWFAMVGGEGMTKKHYNYKGNEVTQVLVKYGRAKWCHYMQDGTKNVRLHFMGEDASTASMFLIKFNDNIINHNFRLDELEA